MNSRHFDMRQMRRRESEMCNTCSVIDMIHDTTLHQSHMVLYSPYSTSCYIFLQELPAL
jgi:hypothetical protein